jgi:DNA-binding transcriptional LysR family regulator
VTLDLSDRLIDLQRERIDCAIRISDLADSSLVAMRLAENRRVVVASPAYLARHGIPHTLEELASTTACRWAKAKAAAGALSVMGR